MTTRVAQTVSFYNNQYFSITGNAYLQDISQGTTVSSYTTVSQPGAANIIYNQNYTFPLTVDISLAFLTNGNINQTTKAKQIYQQTARTTQAGKVTFSSFLENAGQHVDTLELDSSFNLLGNKGQSSAQQYNHYDSTGAAYDCAISAAANALTAYSPGCSQ